MAVTDVSGAQTRTSGGDRAVVTNAKVMLKYGSRQVAEVAYATGFSSPKYFTRCFTKEFKVKPSELLNKGDKQASE